VNMFDAGKTTMIGLPCDEKTVTIVFRRFRLVPERNGRTERRTNK